jgi:hypothetical protein
MRTTPSATHCRKRNLQRLPTEKTSRRIDCWNYGIVVKQGLGAGALDAFCRTIIVSEIAIVAIAINFPSLVCSLDWGGLDCTESATTPTAAAGAAAAAAAAFL